MLPTLAAPLSWASVPWRHFCRMLHRLAAARAMARRSRDELAGMGARELSDLGIGRGDIGGMLDDAQAWRKDRR